MTAPPRRHVALGDDSGAVLILALIIVTVVALVVTTLLSFTDTSLRTTVAVRDQGSAAATADGAAQAAINTLRLSPYNNNTQSTTYPQCFGTTDTLVLANLVPGSTGKPANSAAVRCSPDPVTGASGGLVPITAANKPGNAILTLGQIAGEDGLNIKALNGSIPFNVHGGVVSNSNIRVTNGSLRSTTEVYAHTGCVGTIIAPTKDCGAGTAPDPNYVPETTTVPTYRPVPANCSAGIVPFEPGYYDDAMLLTDLMTTNGCRNAVWWFKPGIYYFDFQNATKSSGSANPHQWTVGVGQLVAGTPTDNAGNELAQPQRPATVPGACANPIHSTTAVGVQFIFGGDSQLQVAGTADAEICGSYHTDRPPIAVYGLKSGTATPTTANNAPATTVTGTVTGGPTTGFTPPAGGTLASGVSAADGAVDTFAAGASGGTATLRLSDFVPASGIPAGSILSSARVRIVFGTSTTATTRTLTVTPSSYAGAGSAITPTPAVGTAAVTAGSPAATKTFDLTASLQATVHDRGLTGLTVDYSTRLPANGNEQIDAVLLDLTYTAPALRGQTTTAVPGNCLAMTHTGTGSGPCAVLATETAYKGKFYVQGTTYTPIAPIDITLSNITEQVLRFGVISRSLWVKETGAIAYVGPVIEIPDDSPGYGPGGTVVFLEVFVCRAASTCTIAAGMQPNLTARVFIDDPTGTPVAGSRQMTIQSWSVLRR